MPKLILRVFANNSHLIAILMCLYVYIYKHTVYIYLYMHIYEGHDSNEESSRFRKS